MADANGDMSSLDEFIAHSPEMLFVARSDGALLRWSDMLARTIGPVLSQGTPLTELFHPEDRCALSTGWEQVRGSTTPVQVHGRILSAERSYRRFSCVVRGSRKEQLIYGSLRDVPLNDGVLDELTRLRDRDRILGALIKAIPVVVWSVDSDGVYTYHDGKGLESAGHTPGQFVGKNIFEIYGDSAGDVRRTLAGDLMHGLAEAHGCVWESWMIPVSEPAGQVRSVIGFSLDVTEAKRAQQALQTKVDVIEAQQRVIRDLSAPIIEVWDGVLALPMIGVVDSARTAEAMESLLDAISRRGARFAVLDLTGVQVVDTKVADHLIKIVKSIQLLGAEGIVCGIRPNVAQTMVELGLDLSAIVTKANLRAGLTYCMQRLNVRATTPRGST
ncbi:anti-anti-sigma factor [Sorangium cellulosum]|uniref:Anti-anti-sigma factor n=1 Tax=Sorangium cellulosum TaxID=56 RepID=A0A2L0EXC0_SORCE|nr:STAS domain-containing protein [Sorangium cellulosum]AUX43951.1 anti-anti-sigma factor [Sorangium cellulosum]